MTSNGVSLKTLTAPGNPFFNRTVKLHCKTFVLGPNHSAQNAGLLVEGDNRESKRYSLSIDDIPPRVNENASSTYVTD
jgi:hypothetical protein